MTKLIKTKLLIIITLILAGCVGEKVIYIEPKFKNEKEKYTIELNESYDKVWSKLIQYSATTFFAIDNYEKDSGLITLSFGSSTPSKFIKGGHFQYQNFGGDYVTYLSRYANNTKLDGKMNIVVIKKGINKTLVKIHARYVFDSSFSQGKGNTWVFETGTCDTLISNSLFSSEKIYRTICPTHNAEEDIIRTLKDFNFYFKD